MRHFVLFAVVGALALSAQAQTPPADAPARTANDATAAAADVAAERGGAERPLRHDCLRSTGTRIRSRDENGCLRVFSPSRVYSRSDIERTGETEIAEALQRLDPSISIH